MMKFSTASKMMLFAGAVGLTLAAVPANAQSDDSITVTAPRFHSNSDGARLNGPLEAVSYTGAVRYDDLNLRTRSGARELKIRVRDEAQEVCMRIAEVYPVREQPGTSCYKKALSDGLAHADAAISDARFEHYAD